MPAYLLHDFFKSPNTPSIKTIMEELCKMALQCAKDLELDQSAVRVDGLSLYAALDRYARDSFGYQRICDFVEERFESFSMGMESQKKNDLMRLKEDLFDELETCGIRISSKNPYVHKKCAFLLYHFTVLKPFYISHKVDNDPKGEKIAYFNANVGIYIVNAALATCNLEFLASKDTLRDLTYRLLSRSAMEAIIRSEIRGI